MSLTPAVVFDSVDFAWPDGQVVLSAATATFGRRTGLIGRNGVGKSTVLRLIGGQLTPQAGRIVVPGAVAVLPQSLTWQAGATMVDVLGIADQVAAIRAVEAGVVDAGLYELIGTDWDLEARAAATLSEVGLGHLGLDRGVATMSGGEVITAALAGLRLARAEVTVLDEPTNNLDGAAREVLYQLVDSWPGVLVVVSHDVELLDRLDHLAELHSAALTTFGGNYSAYQASLDRDQAAAAQAVATAKQQLRTERRQRIEAETKLARSARQGRRDVANSRFIGAAADERGKRAEARSGALRGRLDDRVTQAEERLATADRRLRRDKQVTIVLPDPQVAPGRRLAEFVDGDQTMTVVGATRLALGGANGVGKTRLLDGLFAEVPPLHGPFGRLFCDRVGYLPQRLDEFDDSACAVASVAAVASGVPDGLIRRQLAAFGLTADTVDRPVSTLSGGERLAVALARILLADPPPQLVILDEPTNNLDLAGRSALIEALLAYRGGLIVVSHDRRFLAEIGLTDGLEVIRTEAGPSLRPGVWLDSHRDQTSMSTMEVPTLTGGSRD